MRLRNAREEGDGGGFESVLQEHGAIEPAQASRGGPFFGQAARLVGNQLIAERLARVKAGHPGAGQDGDMRVRKAFAEGAQCGQRHDRVAHPVGGAHEDAVGSVQ
jgi:hypothetical protein